MNRDLYFSELTSEEEFLLVGGGPVAGLTCYGLSMVCYLIGMAGAFAGNTSLERQGKDASFFLGVVSQIAAGLPCP